jgi:Flp pilus assembly pilin Flp
MPWNTIHDPRGARLLTWLLTRRPERAASLVEYALLIALVALVMIGAVTLLGETTAGSLDRSGSSLLDATG